MPRKSKAVRTFRPRVTGAITAANLAGHAADRLAFRRRPVPDRRGRRHGRDDGPAADTGVRFDQHVRHVGHGRAGRQLDSAAALSVLKTGTSDGSGKPTLTDLITTLPANQ
jgi:hypothetical protein